MGRSGETRGSVNWPGWVRDPYAKPFLQSAFDLAMPTRRYDSSTGQWVTETAPYNQGLNQQVAGLDPMQTQAIEGIGQVGAGQQGLYDTSINELQKTLGGEYLSPESNPHLRGLYDSSARALTDQYMLGAAPQLDAAARDAQAYGGSAHTELANAQRYGLGQNLTDLANQVYGGAYESERGRQLYGQQLVPAVTQAQYTPFQQELAAGDIRRAQQQQELDVDTQNVQREVQWPFQLYDFLSGAIQGGAGPGQMFGQSTPGTLGSQLRIK